MSCSGHRVLLLIFVTVTLIIAIINVTATGLQLSLGLGLGRCVLDKRLGALVFETIKVFLGETARELGIGCGHVPPPGIIIHNPQLLIARRHQALLFSIELGVPLTEMHKEALNFLAGLGGLRHGVDGSDPPQLAITLQSILDPLLGDVGMGEGNAEREHDRRRRGRRHCICFCIGNTTAKTKINLEKV